MRNDDDADALRSDPLDHLKASPRLFDAKGREGLVQQHELAAPMDEPVQFDRLPLTAGKMLDIDAERWDLCPGIGHRLLDDRLHLPFLQDRNAEKALYDFAPHEEVRDDIDVRTER